MSEKSLHVLRYLPRISINNLRRNPHTNYKTKQRSNRGQHGGKRHGWGHKGSTQKMSYNRVGFESYNMPFYLKMPMEPYYKNHHLKKQYPPLSLANLQLMIDTGKINPKEPIDLGVLCSTNVYTLTPEDRHFGVHLTDEGLDHFTARVNIEVQHAKEQVIAAIEKNGGVITNAFYDISSIYALKNPYRFFGLGKPIPKRQLPNEFEVEYYIDPKSRGYLADPELIAKERLLLAQKYGYVLPDISKDPLCSMLMLKKDPRQVFYGLRPGWLVNLKDKKIIEPLDPRLREYYELD